MIVINERLPAHDDVLRQLDRILSEPPFTSSTRHSRFLEYVVNKALEGKNDEVKEVVIAADLYGRKGDYDPKVDSIVRVEAIRLRAKLDKYYEQRGARDPIRITIPKGTYVPQFEFCSIPEQPIIEPPDISPVSDPGGDHENLRGAAATKRTFLSGRQWIVLTAVGLLTFFVFRSQILWHSDGAITHATSNLPGGSARAVHPEALAAWQEGNDLLAQDPHSGLSDRGAPATLERAIERHEFAVAKDPSFAAGWASLAESYDYASSYVGRNWEEDARRAEAAARRAVALDEKLAAGHAMLGLVMFGMRFDFAAAEKEYRRAIELDPRRTYAIVEYADLLRETGRSEQAAAEIRKGRALLPALPVLAVKEAEIQLDLGQADAAIVTATAAVRLNQDYRRAHVALGMAYEAKGDFERALTEYRAALAVHGHDRRALPALGYLLGTMGQREEAQSVLRKLEDLNERVRNVAYHVGVVYAGLGEQERALDWLERAYKTRQAHAPFMARDYRLRTLRQHPRFIAILDQLGLKPVG